MKVNLDIVKANEYNYLLASAQSNRLYPPAIYFMTQELKDSLKNPKDRTKKKDEVSEGKTKIKLKIPFDPQYPDKTFTQEVEVFEDGTAEE